MDYEIQYNCGIYRFKVMEQCWKLDPNERPSFPQLCQNMYLEIMKFSDVVSYYPINSERTICNEWICFRNTLIWSNPVLCIRHTALLVL